MATKIVTKNSSTASAVPTASDLVQGELAVNVADKRLFTEDNGGSIVELGTNPSTIDINAGSIDGTAIGASSASTGAFTTLTATGLTVDTTTLAVDSTNNRVGIGTSAPSTYGGKLNIIDGAVGGESTLVIANNNANQFVRVGINDNVAQIAYDNADSLAFGEATDSTTAGLTTERMRIDSSGNVGIDCVNPDDGNLQIGDANSAFNIAIAGPRAKFGYDGANAILQGGVAKGITFCVNSSTLGSGEAMRIDSSGKVGIGTTSPASKAHIFGSSNDTINQANANLNLEGLGGNGMLFGTQATSPYRSYIQAGFVDNLATATYDLLLNPQGGKVGIRTTSPEYNLDVTAADNVTTTTALSVQNASRNYGLGLGAYTLTNRNIGGTATTVDYTFDIGRHAIFKTGNAERMRIDSVGNVIVGKTTSATGTQGFVVSPNGSIFSSISSGNTYHTYNTTNNLFTFYVGYTGGVINYQANNVNLSDEREKKNIEPLESKWDSVKSWSLKTFHYNHQADESIKNYGVIAQDVEQTNPEAIDFYQKDENTERKGVKEQQMMWMAIKALQEAQTRIETLETRIAALEE